MNIPWMVLKKMHVFHVNQKSTFATTARQINIRENRKDNQELTIQRHWQQSLLSAPK
jgi:hypothetical protein